MKITDMRVAVIGGAPMTCAIIRLDTDAGIYGLGEVRDGASKTYALMLKSRLLGENPLDVDRLFRKIKQFGHHGRQGLVRAARHIIREHLANQGVRGKAAPETPRARWKERCMRPIFEISHNASNSGQGSCANRFVTSVVVPVALSAFLVTSSAAQPHQAPIAAESLRLFADKPSPTYRTLVKPISIEFLLAGLKARDRKLKSGYALTEFTSTIIGPYADALSAATAQPNVDRRAGEPLQKRIRCEWRKSGAQLSYRTVLMEGNEDDVRLYSRMAAAFDGKQYRTYEVYRADGLKHAAISSTPPAAFTWFYLLDPRHFGELWFGHISTLRSQLTKRQTIADVHVSGTEEVFGSPCYRVAVKYSTGDRWYLWLDQAHDLMIRHSESIAAGHKRVVVADVPELSSSNGVWMVRRAEQREYALATPGNYVRIGTMAMTVEDFKANQPIAASEFTLKLEPGTVVDDVDHARR